MRWDLVRWDLVLVGIGYVAVCAIGFVVLRTQYAEQVERDHRRRDA